MSAYLIVSTWVGTLFLAEGWRLELYHYLSYVSLSNCVCLGKWVGTLFLVEGWRLELCHCLSYVSLSNWVFLSA